MVWFDRFFFDLVWLRFVSFGLFCFVVSLISGVSEIMAPNNFGSALSKAALKGPLRGPLKGRNRAASADQLDVLRSYKV